MTEPINPPQSPLAPCCGILCDTCPLGSGAVAESASQTRKHITDCQIPMWSPFVPGGEAIDWAAVDCALDWMTTYARCAGCHSGGGPLDCARFEWLGKRGRRIAVCCGRNNFLPNKHGAIQTVNTTMLGTLMQAGNPDTPS